MPFYDYSETLIKANLIKISMGEKVGLIKIGILTDVQFNDINSHRTQNDLPTIKEKEILYLGKHHYDSRTKDGYKIEDIILQIKSAMSEHSVVVINRYKTSMENRKLRFDGYISNVKDTAIFELTSRRPHAELFSVIPKNDTKPIDIQPTLLNKYT